VELAKLLYLIEQSSHCRPSCMTKRVPWCFPGYTLLLRCDYPMMVGYFEKLRRGFCPSAY
jgi:hypothetical protein